MNLFEQYFSEADIIRELCKARVKLAKFRHERQFLYNIRGGERSPDRLKPDNWGAIPPNIFPPRRQWHSFRPRTLQRKGRPSLSINRDALFRATLKLRGRSPTARWAKNLNKVVAGIRERVFGAKAFVFTRPTISPGEKNAAKHEYRPLVQFRLEDKVVDCLTARYLRESFDALFHDSCLAFRCRNEKGSVPTTHSALDRIVEMNRRLRGKGLFVAECDIKGFFDCVSHQLVKQSIRGIVDEARTNNPLFNLDPRAITIVNAYLDAYAFSRDVHALGPARAALRAKDAQGKYKWPIKDLRLLYGNKKLQRIGVPQGGALSCFIANVVLHTADRELDALTSTAQKRLLYMRYCDDMILVSTDLKACRAAFVRYRQALKKLRLPIHPPKRVRGYLSRKQRREFWSHKSNYPYRWSSPQRRGIPWIQFVGYQVRYDGLIRIRPRSVRKEFSKMKRATRDLLRNLDPSRREKIRRGEHEIRHRFRMKLISMAVGRRMLGPQIEGPLPMCWTNGFRGLVGRQSVSQPLSALDRHREQQVKRIERHLKRLGLPKRGGHKVPVHRYYGHPFSYRAQFPGKDKQPARNREGIKAPRSKHG